MTGPELLSSHAGVLRTWVGACWPGSRAVFRGHDLHRELGDMDWLELYVFGITGRRYSDQEVRLLHGIWVLTSYPDARLWNNRVGALASSARSTAVLGLSAAVATTEARIYGGGPGVRAIDFFLRAGKAVKEGGALEAFVHAELASRRIYGYGRPLNTTDERLPSLIPLAVSLGFDQGYHYRLAFEVERVLLTGSKPFLRMNFAALTAALAADLGFSPRQYQLFNILKTLAGIPPCIVEAESMPEGVLFPTPCDGVVYEGVGKRRWGR